MDQDPLGGLALRGMGCLDIGVAQMGVARIGEVEPLLASVGELYRCPATVGICRLRAGRTPGMPVWESSEKLVLRKYLS